jgi:Asp-tRNA(Asn)/Glu-tRNA(Gln) amidotransferase B subunit
MSMENVSKKKMSEPKGITMAAAKFIYKQIIRTDKNPLDVVDEFDLWMADEWTHVGFCILACLDSQKLVETYKKGNTKVFDSIVGKTIKMSNMTVEPELIRELLPLIIAVHF